MSIQRQRSPLDSLVTEKALRIVNGYDNSRIVDMMADDPNHQLPLKNVCAKVSVDLSEQIDQVCALLDISKRQFLEMAFIEALDKANRIIEEEGVFEALENRSSRFTVLEEGK